MSVVELLVRGEDVVEKPLQQQDTGTNEALPNILNGCIGLRLVKE
jgi:hypothetical protein